METFMKVICMFLSMLWPLWTGWGYHTVELKGNTQQEPALLVKLTPLKEVYHLGEPIKVRVELENIGVEPIYVGNEIPDFDWVYSISFSVLNSKGEPTVVSHFFHPQINPSRSTEPNPINLTKHWLVLPARYFVGTVIELKPEFFEAFKTPGDYVIRGIYSSEGVDANISSNPIGVSPEFISSLPYKSWKGKLQTNPIKISILKD
jgi:hypothetical protein